MILASEHARTMTALVRDQYGNYPIPGLGVLINALVDFLLDIVVKDLEFMKTDYRPAVREIFQSITICSDASYDLFVSIFKICL